jgi:dihydroflavonol-4-reductase
VVIAVTGADGMLGNHIVRELLYRGYQVKALVQPGRSTGTLDGLGLELVPIELTNPQEIQQGLLGVEGVIHTAASTQIWPGRSSSIWDINYHAVKRISDQILEQGIKRFVHIGTANSFGPGSKENPGIEENPYTDHVYKLDYQDSKFEAQSYLLEQYRTKGLPVTIINPTFMFGAYDTKPGSGQMILSVYQGKVPGFTRGGKSFVSAKDVAFLAVEALERGRLGQCYLASGENLSYQEAFRKIAHTLGVKPPRFPIPSWLGLAIGALGSSMGKLTGKPPILSYPAARLGNSDCYYSNQKAINELNMPQTPLEEAILEAFDWFKEHGYV